MSIEVSSQTDAPVVDGTETPAPGREAHYEAKISEEQLVIDYLSGVVDEARSTDPNHPAIKALNQTIARSESLANDFAKMRDDRFGFGRS
jgi:hypothetical protein